MLNNAPVVLFMALVAIHSPLAILSAYMPIVRPFSHVQVRRLALGLFFNVSVIMLTAIWVGEPLLELLGLSTAALIITGGIALAYEGIPLMQGHPHDHGVQGELESGGEPRNPRAILLTPLTFPLTVEGAVFAVAVAASASVGAAHERVWLSTAAIGFAAVVGLVLYLAGHIQRRISPQGALMLDRLAGILLTSIAATLLAKGGTELVQAAMHHH